MRPVTDSFLSTVRGAHKAVFRARILSPGLTGTNPGPLNADGSPTNEIPILGGDVTFDTKSDVNASLSLTTQYDWPLTATALGTPYGQEIYVERGVQYGNGTKEYVGLGYFRINSVEQQKIPAGTIRITAEDRMSNCRDSRPHTPNQFTAGTSVGAILDLVVGDAQPGGSVTSIYDFSAYTTFLTSDHILDNDRVKFINELVGAYGKISYFDYAGRFIVKTDPSLPTNPPVWTVNTGLNGVLVSMKRNINRDGVYNHVVATGEPVGDQAPVRGEAKDLAATSPTLWGGNFGKVVRFFSSAFLTTTDQCTAAATSILAQSTGLPYVVQLGTVPNPALEGWDVISVSYSDKLNPETHIVDRVTYSLSVDGAMGIDTRKQFLNG